MMDTLDTLAERCRKLIRQDKDMVIAITGTEGSGKSTLAIQLARKIDPRFTLDNVIFNPKADTVSDAIINKLPKYSCLVIDEAIKTMYKLDWYKEDSKFLQKLFTLIRKQNLVIIMNIPNFQQLAPYYRNQRVQFHIHVLDRGIAVGFEKSWIPFLDDPWNTKAKIRYIMTLPKINYNPNLAKKLDILRNVGAFMLTYQVLEPDLKEKYNKLADKAKYEMLQEQPKKEGTRLRFYRECLGKLCWQLTKGKYNYTPFHISNLLGIHPTQVKRFITFAEKEKLMED